MPRRGFFRGGGGGEKKSSKKQQKLQQKLTQHQQQALRLQQQHHETRFSSSQASSSNNNEGEPPLGLDGPPLAAPYESGAYDPRGRDVHYQPGAEPSPSAAPEGGIVASGIGGNFDQAPPYQSNDEQQQQYLYHQHQAQLSVPPSNQTSQLSHQLLYDENAQSQQYVHHQPQPPHETTPPFASQPYPGHAESPQQQQPQQYPTDMMHPSAQHNMIAAAQSHMSPTVDNAVDEIWRCETDDFRSASHAIQMLRLAIVAEWESQQLIDGEGNPSSEAAGGGSKRNFSYDPSDTFLSLQGATLRFHARFEAMKAERDANNRTSSQRSHSGDHESVAGTTVNTQNQSLNGVEWELTEQAAWEVWEEAVRTSAALTHACVGPAWREQLKLRRQLIRESEMRLLHQPYMQQHHGRFAADNMSVASSVGGTSMASSLVSMDMSNPQSSGRQLYGGGAGSVLSSLPPAAPVWQPPTDILDMLSFAIPEVLPAAMIRFAASVIETSIPPLRTMDTKIYWDTEKSVHGIAAPGGGSDTILTKFQQQLQDERRWLRRRKRLGDTQRDLAFGLFCGGNDSEMNDVDPTTGAAATENAKSEKKWSIPGAHTPVAMMIYSWLETCQAWPIPREIEGGVIPYHLEETPTNAQETNEDGRFDDSTPPPSEIVLTVNTDPSDAKGHPMRSMSSLNPDESNCAKFSYWGDLIDNPSFDWWYTLRVLRDCSDLVSAGWRPPPSGSIGEGIILSLISIAERGISHLAAGDADIDTSMPEEHVRKERLVACSCASESLVALKTLASREVIPQTALRPLATSLCRLISAAEVTPSSSSTSFASEKEEDALFEREIVTQRTFVASNSAELLWVLLSNESTACPTTDSLLDAIDMDLSDEVTDENRAQVEARVMIASGAIRALSAAMWGDPPSVQGVPLLRFFWEPIIDLYGSVASSFFDDDTTPDKFTIAAKDTSVVKVDDQATMYNRNTPYLTVVLEIILALQRLVDSEMVYGSGDLCATEWESFVKAIDVGIAPWLVRRINGASILAQEIRIESMAIFSQITQFLDKCSLSSSGFHPLVDDDAREYLHLFLLRKAAPLLQMVDSFQKPSSHPSIIGDDATTLALAVIKSWSVLGYLPFKNGDWSKRAGHLLEEAFAVPRSEEYHRYINGYIHHPLVRLEALKSLVDDDSSDIDYSTTKDSDSVSTYSGISTITPVSMKSGNIPPVFSLFTLTKNLRELHLILVNSIILPRLEETLSTTKPVLSTIDCQPAQHIKRVPMAETFDIIEKEFILRRFAVKVLGMLFRSRTGEGEKRHYFIELLQRVATSTPYGIREWVRKREQEDVERSPPGAFISPSQFLRGEEMSLRLEAVRQIEICLGATFSSLPHAHGNVPDILKALCQTARTYALDYEEDAEYEMVHADRMLMTLASIMPLARLSCARNGAAILMKRQHVARNIPGDIFSVVSVDEWLSNFSPMVNETLPIVSEENDFNSDHGDIAPFVFVKQYHGSGKDDNSQPPQASSKPSRRRQTHRHHSSTLHSKEGTIVDFEPVAAVIKEVLQAVSFNRSSRSDHGGSSLACDRTISPASLAQLPSILCTISYMVLSLFMSHGMAFPGADDLLWLNVDPVESRDNENELVSRSQAVSDFAGVLGHLIVSHTGGDGTNLQLLQRVCFVLVQLSRSNCHRVVQHACCGLISILASLRHRKRAKKGKDHELYDGEIHSCLVSFIDHVCTVVKEKENNTDQVLIPLVDAMREAFSTTVIGGDSTFQFPLPLRRRAFLTLFQPVREQWELQAVAYQCVVAIINTLTPTETRWMAFFAIGPDRDTKLPNSKRIQPLLIDLLRSRLMSSQLLKTSTSPNGGPYKASKVHERLAREALALEKFPVETAAAGSPKLSAWKAGNAILTLRMGCEDSSYRGWVEVVVRSPSSRIRRLVKWKKEGVSEKPCLFLPFYQELHTRSRKDAGVQKEDDILQEGSGKEPMFVESEESLRIMAKAKSVIARFDSLFEGTPEHEGTPEQQESSGDVAAAAKPEKPNFDFVPFLPRRNSRAFGEKKQVMPSSLKRTFSDGNLALLSMSRTDASHQRKRSVYSWLQYATGRDEVDVDLIHELEVFGFSREALGVPDTVLTPRNSNTDLFVHEKLKPFTIGSNFNRAMTILDRVTPFQTHRIALFFGGPHSTKRSARSSKSDAANNEGDSFLMATQASTDFWEFARELGDLVPVRHCKYFSGGLDTSESLSDGSFAFVWFGCQGGSYELNEPISVDSMVVFHTVTLMPDRVVSRKRHVGNDVVHIVYGLDVDTLDVDHERMAISGQFGFVTIYVIPLVHVPLFKICVHLKAGLDKSICSALDHLVGSWLISRRVGGHFVRNLAIQADVICQSMIEDKLGLVLNTEERNGRIKDTARHLA